jgi:ABC-2 type transport system permease protein
MSRVETSDGLLTDVPPADEPERPRPRRGCDLPSSKRSPRVVSAKVSLRRRVADLADARELLVFLIRKEVKVKYKDSVLGFAWSMLNPAFVLAIYYVVFKYFLQNKVPYFALFLFSGLLAWNLFNTSLMGASGAIVGNAGIVKKVSFPREILALSQVGTAIVFFFFQGCVLALFLIGFQYAPAWSYMPVFVLAFVALVVFASALSVFLSALNVYLRDVQHLIQVVLQAWFFAVPIVYTFGSLSNKGSVAARLSHHPVLQGIYLGDPLVWIVLAFQRTIYGLKSSGGYPVIPTWGYGTYVLALAIVLAVSVVLLVLAMMFFRQVEGNFAEEL